MNPVTPNNEPERLSALKDLRILDTPPEERFDRITRLAGRLFDTPIALVSLVDADRLWFKSRYGFGESELEREPSFCGQAILQPEALVIPDAQADPRFADMPMVARANGVRFYAGQPLHSPAGLPVGVLCILDFRPRQFSAQERETLADLAAWVERELSLVELATALQQLQEAHEQLTRLSQVREQFVHTVIHKFRSALTGIQGFSELLRDQNFSVAEIHEFAEEINKGAHRLDQMISEMLDADRIILQSDKK